MKKFNRRHIGLLISYVLLIASGSVCGLIGLHISDNTLIIIGVLTILLSFAALRILELSNRKIIYKGESKREPDGYILTYTTVDFNDNQITWTSNLAPLPKNLMCDMVATSRIRGLWFTGFKHARVSQVTRIYLKEKNNGQREV